MFFENILVTGCGGDIGISIAKILKNAKCVKRLIGCDIHNEHAGRFFFDKCVKVRRVDYQDGKCYFDDLETLVKEYSIDLIIPTIEIELRFFLKNSITRVKEMPLVMVNAYALDIGLDKLKTVAFLKKNNFLWPWTKIVKDELPQSLPCIIKNRVGAGAKNFAILYDHCLIEHYACIYPDYIWQEYLSPATEEYTCGLAMFDDNNPRVIIFKRRLQQGMSVYGEVVKNNEIEDLLRRVALTMDLRGSINVQLMLTARGPVIFEINPRFSSTVAIRHFLGYKDVIWTIQQFVGEKIDCFFGVPLGSLFFRDSGYFFLEHKNNQESDR